jgi:tetratricopeptide (TPR) repeat protein
VNTPRRLTKPRAQELALLRGELYELTGQPAKVVATLEQQEWSPTSAQTIAARILWGNALRQQGQSEAALTKFQEGLTLQHKLLNQGAQLHTLRGLTYLQQRDMQQVRQQVARARLQVEYLQGALHDLSGEYERSLTHYQAALAIAHDLNDASDMAHVQHHLALLRGRQQGLAAAASDYADAMRHYEQIGNRYRLEVVRSNLANTQIQSRHFVEAVEAAGKALRFFQSIGDSVRIAQNASNLAEALTELDRLDEAEGYARLVLEQEEPHSHPYALYTLGTIQRKRGLLPEAELYYAQARQVAELNEDHYLLAYAWEALGQLYKMTGKIAAAQQAIRQAEAGFQKLGIAEKATEPTALRQELE